MRKCDNVSKEKIRLLEQSNTIRQIKYYRIVTSYCKGIILDKNISSLIRDLDTKYYEKNNQTHLTRKVEMKK